MESRYIRSVHKHNTVAFNNECQYDFKRIYDISQKKSGQLLDNRKSYTLNHMCEFRLLTHIANDLF